VSAKYGYEFVFHKLYDEFGLKISTIHKNNYVCIPSIYNILTEEDSKLLMEYKWILKAKNKQEKKESNVRQIYLSTLFFTDNCLPKDVLWKCSHLKYRVLFAHHSSMSETVDFVKGLKPKNIYANVKPNTKETLEEVEFNLRKICNVNQTSLKRSLSKSNKCHNFRMKKEKYGKKPKKELDFKVYRFSKIKTSSSDEST